MDVALESPVNATAASSCSHCCFVYTARLKLDPSGYNSIQYFRGVTLAVAGLTIIIATILVGRQQKRRPDINSFQRKLLLFVIGLICLHMIGGILPITMGSIVMAYGYDKQVPWYLWVRPINSLTICEASSYLWLVASCIAGATWSIAWFICIAFYFTPHRASWKKLVVPPLVVLGILSLVQFFGSEFGRGDNIWWGYITAEILLLPFFLFCFVNAFIPIGSFYPRPILRYWAGYLVFMHSLYLATYILIERGKESQYCLAIIEESFFSATFAPVIYFVLRSDGKYLAEETAPLLDLYKEGTLNLIPWDELQIEKDIRGAGSQGTVYKAHWGSESVAIKKITLPPSTPSKFGSGRLSVSPEEEEAITALNREASYLVELRHPSIVQFYGITRIPEGKDVFGLVTKYMEHNLFGVIQEQVISQATPISWSTRLKWIRDLAFGLRYLHSKGINHGDIKSMNVLLSADLQSCQICDFGSAGRAATATLHTPQWSSPEVLQGGIYTRKSDVYSFGVLVWEIVTFHHPYERKSLLEAQRLIKAGQTPLVLWPELVPSDIPEVISKILDATLRKSASKRPSMEAICKSLSAQGPEEGTWTMLEPEDDGWVDPNAPIEDAFVHLDDASDAPPRRL